MPDSQTDSIFTPKPVLRNFLKAPKGLSPSQKRWLVFSNYGAVVAAVLHASFCLLFLAINVPTLAIFNVASALMYLLCLYFNTRGRLVTNLVLVTAEVVTHAILGTLYLGWAAGFHYYLLAMATVIFFTPWRALGWKVGLVLILSGSYILLKQFTLVADPITPQPLWLTRAFDWSNIFGLVGLIAVFAYYYNAAANAAEDALVIEHERSERLLKNILPTPIAERLKDSQDTIADGFEETTTLFSDIVGFTKLSEKVSPEELVEMLNQIFTVFDQLAGKHGIEKIKTIGDAYMVAAGLPEANKHHASVIADMGLDMVHAIKMISERIGTDLNIRIGINSGPVVAGVIGRRKFAYDLWGDSVNTAARMESHGIPGRVHVSESTWRLLKDDYDFEERGTIEVKGKGPMKTFLLIGRKEHQEVFQAQPTVATASLS